MSLHYDESRPSSLQRQYAAQRRDARVRMGFIQVRKTTVVHKPPLEMEVNYWPPTYWGMFSEWDISIPQLEIATTDKTLDVLDRVHTVREIQDTVCRVSKLGRNDLLSSRRAYHIVNPRHVAVALCHILTRESKVGIGRLFNGKDHSTIGHSIEKMEPVMAKIEMAIATETLAQIVQAALRECFKIYPPMVCRHGARP